MIVSIHQPAYLPWLGYFHKILLSDIFVYFDTTQFEKNSFINRNKIKTPQGASWLTVSVKLNDHLRKEIREIEIADLNWSKKHWKAIELNYKKAKYWDLYAERLRKIYKNEYKYISDLCYDQLLLFIEFLKIKIKVIKSSELKKIDSKKLQLVLDICEYMGATAYISGELGCDYIENKKFAEKRIKLYFQDYKHPEYSRLWGNEFLPYMSIIDLLFNEGPNSLNIIMKNNITKQDLLNNSKLYE